MARAQISEKTHDQVYLQGVYKQLFLFIPNSNVIIHYR